MNDEPVDLPIDGILDLHHFKPSDLGDLIPDYLTECLKKDIRSVRIIHGKGKGVLRRTVHSILDKDDRVQSYRLSGDRSSWGATLVELKDGSAG